MWLGEFMSEVIYQIGEDREIVYKEGMRQEGLHYLRICESFPSEIIWYSWLIGLFSSVLVVVNNPGMNPWIGVTWLAIMFMWLFWLRDYYVYRHNRCIEDVVVTPRYVSGNTNRRGWWKW